jgi:hypothetical protein
VTATIGLPVGGDAQGTYLVVVDADVAGLAAVVGRL